jgi:hypothetical protein
MTVIVVGLTEMAALTAGNFLFLFSGLQAAL